jgi:hypothetical protein
VNQDELLAVRLFSALPPCSAILLALALAAGGCSPGGSSRTAETDFDEVPEHASESAQLDAEQEIVVVRALNAGDRACYLEHEDPLGNPAESEASFEICERTDLVGRRAQLTRERTPIMAQACQGDPDCALRDTVDLIVEARRVP